eukprot:7214-Prymnesium_polylepis.1
MSSSRRATCEHEVPSFSRRLGRVALQEHSLSAHTHRQAGGKREVMHPSGRGRWRLTDCLDGDLGVMSRCRALRAWLGS